MEHYILITGATDGIGFRCAREFALLNKNIIIHGRNLQKLNDTKRALEQFNKNIDIKLVKADFEDLKQTRDAFINIKGYPIDTLINNAGTFNKKQKITKDCFEATYQVNHLAHCLIVNILTDTLVKNSPSKIITVASMAHSNHIDFQNLQTRTFLFGYEGYAQSKLCNILFTFKLARELSNTGVSVNCLHPGVINTKLLINNWGTCGKDVEEGHKMIMFVYNLSDKISGEYLKDFKISKASEIAYDTYIQNRCYETTLQHLKDYLTY